MTALLLPAIIALLGFLFMSALFSALEAAYVSLDAGAIQGICDRYPRRGKVLREFGARPERLLATLLIGNNLANIGASALVTATAVQLFSNVPISVTTGLLTLAVLIFCEVTPKQIALEYAESFVVRSLVPLRLLSLLLAPFVYIVTRVNVLLGYLLKTAGRPRFSEERLLNLVRFGAINGHVDSYEQDFIRRVLRFNDITVREVMTHRTDVFILPEECNVADGRRKIVESGFSRVPLYRKNKEVISGIVYIKDVERAVMKNEAAREKPLKEFMTEPLFVPENKPISQLFFTFKQVRSNLAVVLDEYGGMAGVTTREDTLEAILGDLYDEDETVEAEKIVKLDESRWRILGDATISQIDERLGTELEHSKDFTTIGGYVAAHFGEIAEEGMELERDEGRYYIEKVKDRRVVSLIFTPGIPSDEPAGAES